MSRIQSSQQQFNRQHTTSCFAVTISHRSIPRHHNQFMN